MSNAELITRIEGLERTLAEIRTSLAQAGASIAEMKTELGPLPDLSKMVDQLTQLEDAKIENQIQLLAVRIERLKGMQKRKSLTLKDFLSSLLKYWTLIAFVVGAIAVVYVYEEYGVGYFESYENTSNTKQSASYYLETGRALITKADFVTAEAAFKTALDINPYNIEARRWLMLSQVLKPDQGRQTFTPEIAEAKLSYLETENPFKSNPLLPYLRGRVEAATQKRDAARGHFEASQAQLDEFNRSNPKTPDEFIGNFVELGILDMWAGNIDSAITHFETPVKKETEKLKALNVPVQLRRPEALNVLGPAGLNHLAECYVATSRFGDAIGVLGVLYKRGARVETYLLLGDYFRYFSAGTEANRERNLKSARTMDLFAEKILRNGNSEGAEESKASTLTFGADYGRILFVPIPLFGGPPFEERRVAAAYKIDQYTSLVEYALSLDHALASDFKNADLYYGQARISDAFNEYRCQFVYKTRFFRNQPSIVSPALIKWFDEKAESIVEKGTCYEPQQTSKKTP